MSSQGAKPEGQRALRKASSGLEFLARFALITRETDSPRDLHDQRHRVAQHVFAKSDQSPQLVSERRGGAQIALPGAQKYREEMDHADPRLEGRPQPLRHRLRRPDADALSARRTMETVEK